MQTSAKSTTEVNKWAAAREQMLLDDSVAYLNTGSFGPLPRPVFDRVTELRSRLAKEPMDFLVRQAPPLLWAARESLAAYLSTDPSRIVFTANVSAAINVVASSLKLAAPGEILLSDHEYGAMHWCWERAATRYGLAVRTFPLPRTPSAPEEIVTTVRDAINDRTRLLFFSHVLSPTGAVLPAKELCALARSRGVVSVIDGAHAPGMIPLQLRDMGCDFYAANCHKWLLAPTGTGFLWIGPGNEDRLQPLHVSWGWRLEGSSPNLRDEFGSTPRIRFLEFEGTRDPCPWLAVSDAIQFQDALGMEAIRLRNAELVRYTRQRVCSLGLELVTPTHPAMHGAMTAFHVPSRLTPCVLRNELWHKYKIETPIIERRTTNLIRVSTHFFNTHAEVDHLTEALAELLA